MAEKYKWQALKTHCTENQIKGFKQLQKNPGKFKDLIENMKNKRKILNFIQYQNSKIKKLKIEKRDDNVTDTSQDQ